eukprot:8409163-Lingulodinium_polyedra.AAC.1
MAEAPVPFESPRSPGSNPLLQPPREVGRRDQVLFAPELAQLLEGGSVDPGLSEYLEQSSRK